jgi:hypothetical protein
MAINIISEKYNGVAQGGLQNNVGDWIKGSLEFKTTVEHEFNNTSKMLYRDATGNNGGALELEWQQGNWEAEGFSAGDLIEIEVRVVAHRNTPSTGGSIFLGNIQIFYNSTISYLTPDPKIAGLTGPLTLANPAQAPYYIVPFASPQDTIELPGSSYDVVGYYPNGDTLQYQYEYGSVRKLTRPKEIEFFFNLTPNNSTAQASVINGQVNRFKHTLPISTSFSAQPMSQLNNPSGGYFKSVTIKQTEDLGATTTWLIEYEFMQWGLVEDGFSEPDYYDASDCLAPIGLIKVFGNIGNPNGVLEGTTTNNIGNTGGFDEHFNGGANPFTTQSIDWFSVSGASIAALDYSAPSFFKAVVSTNGTQTPLHGYKLGLVYRPEDSAVHTNSTFNLGANLLINAPQKLFRPDGIIDATVYPGETNQLGANWDISDVKITIVGNNLEIDGKITPNGGASNYFSAIPDGGRKTTIWLSISTAPAFLGTVQTPNTINRVSLKLFNSDNIDAPIVGVQIPNIISEELYDHGLNLITDNSIDNTTTEDDVLYKSEFLLPTNIDFAGMRTRISAFNPVTLEDFVLENRYISFGNSITQAGVIQVNETFSRNFNLPPTSDRNHISINRKASLDASGFAGYELEYGFLNDWRYWLLQNNVNSFFYDPTEDHNGLNKNWQRFYSGDWLLRVSYFTDLNGVEDFNHYTYKIRPYEDDVNVTQSTALTVLSNGTNPTALVDNEIIEIECIFTWNQNFADEWVEFTVEDEEGGNRWLISSVEDQGNVAANPLKPISGNTKIDVSGTGTNVLTCKALIDTNIIAADSACLSYRVFSAPNNGGGSVSGGKRKTDGTYKKKTDGTIKQKA